LILVSTLLLILALFPHILFFFKFFGRSLSVAVGLTVSVAWLKPESLMDLFHRGGLGSSFRIKKQGFSCNSKRLMMHIIQSQEWRLGEDAAWIFWRMKDNETIFVIRSHYCCQLSLNGSYLKRIHFFRWIWKQ
jgi:hypothetical protein